MPQMALNYGSHFFKKNYHEVSETLIYKPWIITTYSVWKHQRNRCIQDWRQKGTMCDFMSAGSGNGRDCWCYSCVGGFFCLVWVFLTGAGRREWVPRNLCCTLQLKDGNSTVLLQATTGSNLPANHVNPDATFHLIFYYWKFFLKQTALNQETKVAGYASNIQNKIMFPWF